MHPNVGDSSTTSDVQAQAHALQPTNAKCWCFTINNPEPQDETFRPYPAQRFHELDTGIRHREIR